MKCEVVRCEKNPNEWRVECGAETGAPFYVAVFRGWDAERLAREYVDWKTAYLTEKARTVKVEPVEPKFKPGDICVDSNGTPGIITHHVISKGISEVILYKGVSLTVGRFDRNWSSKNPTLLLSLGESYYKE